MSYDGDPYSDAGYSSARPRPQSNRSGGGGGGGGRSSGGRGGDHAREAIDTGGYTEVKVRIQEFYAKYPDGRIVTSKVKLIGMHELDEAPRVMVQAKAYRTPEDPLPGVGTSWMVLPGKTPYTNGSEVENCETSAWGRAIAATGIAIDKNIATAHEVASKQGFDPGGPSTGAAQLAEAAAKAARSSSAPPATEGKENATEAPPGQPEPLSTGGTPAPAPTAPVPVEESPAPETAAPAEQPATPEAAQAMMEEVFKDDKAETPATSSAAERTGQPAEGIDYDTFKRLAREKFLPNGHIATVARDMVEAKKIAQVGGVRELSDIERLLLLDEAIRTLGEGK